MKEQEAKTTVEAPKNPNNPLNENVDVYANEKENGYANDYETACDNRSFADTLILDDFDDDEEYSSFGIGSMSNYIEGKLLEEQERLYRQSQLLEDEGNTFV